MFSGITGSSEDCSSELIDGNDSRTFLSEPTEATIVNTTLITMNKVAVKALTATLFMVMSVVLTIVASVGSERNVLESLPSINSEEQSSEEPVIPENN